MNNTQVEKTKNIPLYLKKNKILIIPVLLFILNFFEIIRSDYDGRSVSIFIMTTADSDESGFVFIPLFIMPILYVLVSVTLKKAVTIKKMLLILFPIIALILLILLYMIFSDFYGYSFCISFYEEIILYIVLILWGIKSCKKKD